MSRRGGGKFSRKNQARASGSADHHHHHHHHHHQQWRQEHHQPYDQYGHTNGYDNAYAYGQSNAYAQDGAYCAQHPTNYGHWPPAHDASYLGEMQPHAHAWQQSYAHHHANQAYGREAWSDNWRDRSYNDHAYQPYAHDYPAQLPWQPQEAYGAQATYAYNNGFASGQRNFHSSAIPREPKADRRSHSPSAAAALGNMRVPYAPSASRLKSAIRGAPRPEYVEQANQRSTRLSDEEAAQRKLLVVLDLNGTLVFRTKSGSGRAKDSTRAVPRPYLLCFLQYCLGISDAASVAASAEAKAIDPAERPHGSHFWHECASGRVLEPESKGRAEVVVWSSAQPFNVDSMVRASLDAEVRASMLRVWARDTLVPQRHFQQKADSVKDLEIVWAELNAWANAKPSPGRLMAEARDQADQLLPDETSPAAAVRPPSPKRGSSPVAAKMSAALKAAREAEACGPWGAENTVLVDDSVDKARLQPYNNLLIPEFGKKGAQMMRTFIQQQLATTEAEAVEDENELEYDSDLSIAEANREEAGKSAGEEPEEVEARREKKPVPESRLDDVLLQTIGVLETLRHQSNVSAFIYYGGVEGYGEAKTALNDTQKQQRIQQGKTPEHWASMGRAACEKLGIPVRAWTPSEAATATAALFA